MEVFKKDSNIFRILSEAISEGIIVVNKAQVIVATNNAADAIFGYEKGELIGGSLETLIPVKYHHVHSHHVEAFLENSGKRKMGHGRDLYGLRKDGSQFPVEAGLNPFNIYDSTYAVGYIFNSCFRAENALLNQGTGIGLNIVKSHLENLGGTINFISEENVGSTFSIIVPISSN